MLGEDTSSLPPITFFLSSLFLRKQRGAGEASRAGVSPGSLSLRSRLPPAGLGEEVINDMEARRGQCSRLMLY